METEVRTYWENTQKPWGKLFYQGVWGQLPPWQGKRLLDFGSGFGITANHLGAKNQVTAVEPNQELLELAVGRGNYRQLVGSVECLAPLETQSFDGIVCHNVLEYAPQRQEILREFARLLGPEGTLSVVKHNLPGVDIFLFHGETPRFLSRCGGFATVNCSTLREKCRWRAANLFFRLRVSLLTCDPRLRASSYLRMPSLAMMAR